MLLSLEAELEGMKAQNKQKELNNKDLVYTEYDFLKLADQIRNIFENITI